MRTTTLEDLPHENARALLPENPPPPSFVHQSANRQLSHKGGQLKLSVAFSLPLLAKLEVSYQVQFDEKADNGTNRSERRSRALPS
ncbi:hypothetical protein, partial [Mesorhizobium sp. M0500]|uniref:hypothetical protein n=1 Tax=Mesorhizobium sp. M0500 TaxID=2956953 RepID=UPI0033352508